MQYWQKECPHSTREWANRSIPLQSLQRSIDSTSYRCAPFFMTDAVPFARLKLSHALAIFRLALILCELQLANPITIFIIINELKRTRNIRIYICLRDIAAASPDEAEHVSQFLGRKRERYIALLLQPQSEFGDCQHVGLRRWRTVAG
jgi:hypothetical protein